MNKAPGFFEKLSYVVADALGLTPFQENKALLKKMGVDYTDDLHAALVHAILEQEEKPKTFPDLLQDVDDGIYAVQMSDDHSFQKCAARQTLKHACERMRFFVETFNDIAGTELYLDVRERTIDGITHLERVFGQRPKAQMRIAR